MLFALTGCFLTDLGPKPSSGSGVAVVGGKPVDVYLSAPESFFAITTTTTGSALAHQATVELEFRAGTGADAEVMLKIHGHLTAVPAAEDVGTHTLPVSGTSGGLVDMWDVEVPAESTLISGTLTLSGVTDDVISGTLRLELSAGGSAGAPVRSTYECTIILGRQYGGDGDFDD
ncbi:MAG TPA: hypothetical protein VD886_10375 [Herpetosiphonaceae bacterium]|nr:hypothetical protein [Herpetosiphonaceae bacterium]